MLADRAGIQIEKPRRRKRPCGEAASGTGETAGGSANRGGTADKRTLLQAMAWAEKQYHQCLLDVARGRRRPPLSPRAGHHRREHRTVPIGLFALERDWILGACKARRSSRRKLDRRARILDWSAFWPGRPRAETFTTVSRAGCCSRSAMPRAAGRHWRPGVARVGHEEPREVRQFARNPAVYQEQAALRSRPGPRGPAKKSHGPGDGRLYRRDRRPSIRVPERGGRVGHGVGRVAYPSA